MGGIVALVAGGDVVLRDGGDAARDRVRLRIVREVIDVVDDGLGLCGQGSSLVMLAPVGEIVPIARV